MAEDTDAGTGKSKSGKGSLHESPCTAALNLLLTIRLFLRHGQLYGTYYQYQVMATCLLNWQARWKRHKDANSWEQEQKERITELRSIYDDGTRTTEEVQDIVYKVSKLPALPKKYASGLQVQLDETKSFAQQNLFFRNLPIEICQMIYSYYIG